MLRILNPKNNVPQKKLITLQNPHLIDGFVKAEAATRYTTDSNVVEDILLSVYLNEEDQLATAVATNLFEENGIVKTLKAVNDIYTEHPEKSNETYLEVIRYVKSLLNTYPTELSIDNTAVAEMSKMGQIILDEILKITKADRTYMYENSWTKELVSIDSFDLSMLRSIAEASIDKYKIENNNLPYIGLRVVDALWYFGGSSDSVSFRNWKLTYLFINSILNVVQIPDEKQFKYELSQLIKKITFDTDNQGKYEPTFSALNKMVELDKKILMTTSDAIILHAEPGKSNAYFNEARRIIHGHGGAITKKPYIILFNNEHFDDLEKITSNLLKDYPDDFPKPDDSYCVHIMWNGIYLDKRIKWKLV